MENARRDVEASRGTDLVRREQLASFARQTPINGFVTLSIALLTAVVLWPVAPRLGVIGWLGLHYALALRVIVRWRRRPGSASASRVPRGLRRARLWAALSGMTWGASAGFLPLVPSTYQLFLIVVVGGMAAGASTTLAAVPGAAVWFILSAILPFSAFCLLQGEPIYFGLALMGIVFAIAMLGASRVVYRTFMESVRAREANQRLLAEFEESRKEWLEISETAEGFALFDADDRLLLWNDNYQRLLSLPESVVERGVPREDLLRAAAQPEGMTGEALESWIEAQLRDERMEARVEKLGNGRWIRRHARRTEDGRTVTAHVDVTELKRAEEALYESRRKELLGQLTGGVAHDFNNLLTVILGNLELLRLGARDDDARTRVDRAIEAALNGSELTQRLLAFAKQQPLSPRPVDVRALVDETAAMMQRTLGSTYDVRTAHTADVVTAEVDPTQLTNALLHLALNARDAMPAGGEVDLETAASCEEFVTISVRDHGQGMSPEVRSRAFEPFFTTKEVGQGSGLGLSMVHGFAEQSGGRVEVDSEEGVSTIVTLYLPRASRDAADDGMTAASAGGGKRPEADTVLVVEDSDDVREYAVRVLRDAGIRVLEARDGAGAIAMLDEPARVDLLFTDVVLPGPLNGRDVARALSERQPDSRILYTSGYSRDAFESEGSLDAGVELLAKPYTPDGLVERVRELLER